MIEPHLGDLRWAKGIVLTELGPVSVSWKRSNANDWPDFEIDVPAIARARLLLPPGPKGSVLTVDGRPIQRSDAGLAKTWRSSLPPADTAAAPANDDGTLLNSLDGLAMPGKGPFWLIDWPMRSCS